VPKRDVVQGYAQGIFEIASAEGDLEEVEDQLYRFAKTLEREGPLREALLDPTLPNDRKRAVLDELLGAKASRHTIALLGFLIDQGRAKDLPKIIQTLGEFAAARHQAAVAEVRTAIPLDGPHREAMAKALAKATGKDIELKVLVDPSVLGGVVARVGDQVFDGSIRRRLEMAREQLAGMR
jgi:F-type H+-transporting ATPase subunit delta